MIQLIIEGKELNISEHAKQWFLKEFMNDKEGPFTWKTVNGTTIDCSMTTVGLTQQSELFK